MPMRTTIRLPASVGFGQAGNVLVDAVCNALIRVSCPIVGATPVPPPPPGGLILYAVVTSEKPLATAHVQFTAGRPVAVSVRSASAVFRCVPLAFSIEPRLVKLFPDVTAPLDAPLPPTTRPLMITSF